MGNNYTLSERERELQEMRLRKRADKNQRLSQPDTSPERETDGKTTKRPAKKSRSAPKGSKRAKRK